MTRKEAFFHTMPQHPPPSKLGPPLMLFHKSLCFFLIEVQEGDKSHLFLSLPSLEPAES